MSYAANPRAPKPSSDEIPQEPTGPIASDSLAAESVKESGAFAENENADVMGVQGANSTLNTTETSGATILHPSDDGATREKEDMMGLGRDEKGTTGGVKYPDGMEPAQFDGTHSLQGYAGGPTSSSGADSSAQATSRFSTLDPPTSSSDISASDPTSAGVRPYVPAAPTYTADVYSAGQLKPKGTDLTEGDIPETKTFTGNVAGVHDPARVAEKQMLTQNASVGGEGVGGVRQGMDQLDGSTGAYDILQSERAGDQGGINE